MWTMSLTTATKQVPVPGSSPTAPSSVYQDITQGLEKVGKGAFGLIPQGLKDALNTEAPLDKGKQPMGSPPKARRSSVGGALLVLWSRGIGSQQSSSRTPSSRRARSFTTSRMP